MSACSIEDKRRRLSQAYELWTWDRIETFGHELPRFRTRRRRLCDFVKSQFLPHYFMEPPTWRLSLRRLAGTRSLPDFCVIGAPKSGTTDLAVSLLCHPNVITPLAKEFVETDPEKWRRFYPTERWVRHYAAHHGAVKLPYLTPYLHRIDIAYRLSQLRPETKVVISLRDPAERAFSQWKWELFLTSRRMTTTLPYCSSFPVFVDTALQLFPSIPTCPAVGTCALQHGIYWKAVEHWIRCFGSSNVLVVDVADYFADRNAFLRRIEDFVGLPHVTMPSTCTRMNENPLRVPSADPESLAKLRAFFRPYNERLWDLLGREFAW